jgi:hypothetical protein
MPSETGCSSAKSCLSSKDMKAMKDCKGLTQYKWEQIHIYQAELPTNIMDNQ